MQLIPDSFQEEAGLSSEWVLPQGKARAFRLAPLHDDRGSLVPLDFDLLDFCPVRMFWVAAPQGTQRGGHGHKLGRQILCAVSGIIRVELKWRGEVASVDLGRSWNSLLIEAPVWARQTYLTQEARLVVLCDTPFQPDGYLLEPELI